MRTILCTMVMLLGVSAAWADEEKVALDKLPKAVGVAIKKLFPKGEMESAVKAVADNKTMYEVTLKDGGVTVDVNVNEDGTVTGFEKEVAIKDMPKVVVATVAAKYPKNKMKKGEIVYSFKDGKETLEYYEIFVEIDGKDVEVEVLPDGKLKPMEAK